MPTLNWIGKEAVVDHHRHIPTRLLECDPKLSFGDPDAENLLVEGDNLEALKALLPRYRGQVKCIYIDPPYNTGNENWIYNDNVNDPRIKKWLGQVVGKEAEDLCRHDKWLCMMYPRLALLREFLRQDGAIFVSIDDNEVNLLRSVMDEIFGRGSFIATFVWQKRYRADRPGQARGIPDIMPALPLFAQLRRFTLAVIAAAETAADFAGILYTDAPANGEADAAEPFEPIELEQRALVTMPGGWKMSQIEAEQPATTYGEFKREILNEISRCLNMPFNIAAGNSSGYNYASGRLDHQTYYKSLRVDQSHIENVVLDRILNAWFDEAALIPGFLPGELGPIADWTHQWFWDGTEHVDPAKEANAQATRLANHTTTLAHEYARQGRDWEEALHQRAKEITLMNELGLSQASAEPNHQFSEEEDGEEEAARAYAA